MRSALSSLRVAPGLAALLALAACPSSQSSTPPDVPPPPPPAENPDRTAAVSPDHPDYARVEGTSFPNDCAADTDCHVGGCSAEICSAEQGVSSTCIAKDWPTKGASCGCVSGQCVWYRGAGGEPSGDASPPPHGNEDPDDGAAVVDEFSTIADQMCACKDKPCAEKVNASFEAWLKGNEAVRGSQAQQERAKEIAERYTRCMIAAIGPQGKPGMGKKCGPGGTCAEGLTCVEYYGVAGAAGPKLSSCEIRCGKGQGECPEGTKCVTIADGPGQVCRPAQ